LIAILNKPLGVITTSVMFRGKRVGLRFAIWDPTERQMLVFEARWMAFVKEHGVYFPRRISTTRR
jgi:hypothetical protein